MKPDNSVKINMAAIRSAYKDKENFAIKALLDDAYDRTRNWGETKVDRAVYTLNKRRRENKLNGGGGPPISRQSVVSGMQKLQELGCGRFVRGRRGQPSRFEWSVQMISVAKVARGDNIPILHLSSAELETSEESDAQLITMSSHVFPLSEGRSLKFELPLDLTIKEAGRGAEFFKALTKALVNKETSGD